MRTIHRFLLILLFLAAGISFAQTTPSNGFSLAKPYGGIGFSSAGLTLWGGADSAIMEQIGVRAGVGFWNMGAMGVSVTLFGISADALYEFAPLEFEALQRRWSFRPHAGAGLRYRNLAGLNQIGGAVLGGYIFGTAASNWALTQDFGIAFLTNMGMSVDFAIGIRYRF